MQSTKTIPLFRVERRSIRRRFDDMVRRQIDILAAFFGLLFLSPLFLLIAIAIRRDTPGPVFFRGRRAGKDGKPFNILKFRTMYDLPSSYNGAPITAAGDERITPLGRWLRDTKINELPQLWNVLTGEMSLVGPRPEAVEIAEKWPKVYRSVLLSVRPGITSPATVVFRNEESQLSTSSVIDDYLRKILPTKLRIDSLYVRNRSIFTDLDVIFMTLACLLPKSKDVHFPETTLYWGPIAKFVTRFLNWFLLDTLTAILAVATAGLIWRMDAPLHVGLMPAALFGLAIAACFSLSNTALGLNRVSWSRAPAYYVILLSISCFGATGVLAMLNAALHQVPTLNGLPQGMIFMSGLFALVGFVSLRYRQRLLSGFSYRWVLARGAARAVGERVLVVGAGSNSQLVTWLFGRSEYARLFSIVGMVDDDPRMQDMYIDGYRVMGTTSDIPTLIRRYDIGLVLYTISNIAEEERQRILKVCYSTKVPVVPLPEVLTDLKARFTVAVPAD
jgi:lipopolysaccharide/colanic/teichoic acid biosynthesis glycosyltransferase